MRGSARAAASIASRSASAATLTRARTLPLTCTGISTVSSTSHALVDRRERHPGQRPGVAQPRPQLLGDVRGQRRDHQHQRLDQRPRRAAVRVRLGDRVVQRGEPGDRRVEAQTLVPVLHRRDGLVQQPVQRRRGPRPRRRAPRRSPRRPPRARCRCSSRYGPTIALASHGRDCSSGPLNISNSRNASVP